MNSDFVGVPVPDWYEARDDVRVVKAVCVMLMVLMFLLVWTLVQRGVLTSWMDLFRQVSPDG